MHIEANDKYLKFQAKINNYKNQIDIPKLCI